MNTKIAIDFLENNIKCVTFPLTPDKVNKIIDEIIELLKRGEKYEKIVKDIKYEIDWHRPEREVYDAGSIGDDEYINETLDLIDNIEKEYFPK